MIGLIGVAVLATSLHRHGHTQGDDFALYLRQASSIFEGNVGQVIEDNRFAVLNSDSGFSPTPANRSGRKCAPLRVTFSVERTRVRSGSSSKTSATSGTIQ